MALDENTFKGMPLATVQRLIVIYEGAIAALGANQSYSISGRSLSRANLPDVAATLTALYARRDELEGKLPRVDVEASFNIPR